MVDLRKLFVVAVSSAVMLTLGGCSTTQSSAAKEPEVDLVQEVQDSAADLLSGLTLSSRKPMLSVSFANIDNLEESSTLGRSLGEQYSSALTSSGVKMIEVKLSNELYISEGTGELILSRDLKRLVNDYEAQAVLVGTYAQGGKNIYVTARIIDIEDNTVLAADNMTLPINQDIRGMMPRRRY